MDRCREFIRNHNSFLILLFETRSSIISGPNFARRLGYHWRSSEIPSLGFSGGILLLWNSNKVQVTTFIHSRQIWASPGLPFLGAIIDRGSGAFGLALTVLWETTLGSSTDWFNPYCGIRQGDPLSTYHFIMCANILSALLNIAMRDNALDGFLVCGSDPICHLMITLTFDYLFYLFPAENSSIDSVGVGFLNVVM
ncbi:hypothetical protein ACMD2_11198 [Ananas comosus]|uniref:Reverse transcriptase domain-containing protein n=1 Tax=Ananas comosus TaxID=4615 RepID=A0A199VQ66_ANACO|nr:hypothetical protein ACMD2_11198 [Ananas comosus]